MKRTKRTILAAVAACLLISSPAQADVFVKRDWLAKPDGLTERIELVNNIVMLVATEQYAALEAMAAEYRDNKLRTASGLWKSTILMTGLSRSYAFGSSDKARWERGEQRIKRWIEAYPTSPTAHIAHARFLYDRGWNIRGTGYSHTVTPGRAKKFAAETERTRRYLLSVKEFAAKDPNWYQLMLAIGVAQNWPEKTFAKYLNEALALEPHFYQTYFEVATHYVPKWGGSAEALEKFARAALEFTKDEEGYTIYARIYWSASGSQYGDDLFTDSDVDWETMSKGIDDVLSDYPDNWNLQNFARFACLAGDIEKTEQLMRRIEGRPIKLAWGSLTLYSECKEWVENRPVPLKEYLRAFVALIMQ